MVQFYVLQIKMGNLELGDVPMLWAENVTKALKQ